MEEQIPLASRKEQILRAVVSDYTVTGIPVGSQLLAAKYFVALSSATIRNELADLVGTGYLQQPHTSAGRIPTDRGYRYFVDIRRAARQEFERAPHHLEGILELSAMVLAQITENVSLVTAPQANESRIKHIDLVSMDPQSVLMILVLEGNLLRQEVLALPRPVSQDDLSKMASLLNQEVRGATGDDLGARLDGLGPQELEQRHIVERIAESIRRYDSQRQTAVLHDGVRNLFRQPEFLDVSRLEELLELLEEGAQLSAALQQVAFEKDVEVIIGRENPSTELRECSLVLTTYRMSERARGTIGVIGSTRMRYGQVVARVRLVSQLTSEALERLAS
jgi:heat-inducible transcriptional repressor